MKLEHTAFYLTSKDDKKKLIQRIKNGEIFVKTPKLDGELYSEIALNKLIEEERKHEHVEIDSGDALSLQKHSNGERKKALLAHIISKNPDYIIVDNIFDSLDTEAQIHIADTLEALSTRTVIIQIATRKKDVLIFIENIFSLDEDAFVKGRKILSEAPITPFTTTIPEPHSELPIFNNPLVAFNDVNIKYEDKTILKHIFWNINKGEFWQLKGPNGSGKSTLLSLITGDNTKAYLQDITLFGVKKGSGESIWDIKQKIGYFSSEMSRGFMRMDSIENMIVSGFFDSIGLYKIPTERHIKIVHKWLRLLGLFDKRAKHFLSLSLGQQRMVLIARAMVKHPPLLILDEPTAGLDDNDATLFTALINKIASESQTAILYVSHRNEIGLTPDFVYELVASDSGSVGKQLKK